MPTQYCDCGYQLWLTYRWNGLASVPIYADNEEDSATVGETITHCPGCGEQLRPEAVNDFRPEKER